MVEHLVHSHLNLGEGSSSSGDTDMGNLRWHLIGPLNTAEPHEIMSKDLLITPQELKGKGPG